MAESSVTRTFLASSLVPVWELLSVWALAARAADPVRRMPVRAVRGLLLFSCFNGRNPLERIGAGQIQELAKIGAALVPPADCRSCQS